MNSLLNVVLPLKTTSQTFELVTKLSSHPDDLGGLKCCQNTKKNKKTLKVSFKAIFNVNFANLVSKEYFSILLAV